MKIGFIGLGIMGSPMAGHLQDAGHEVYSLQHRSPLPEHNSAKGLKVCKTPKEVATQLQQGNLFLRQILEETGWNVAETARRLDLARSHVYNLIRAFEFARDRQSGRAWIRGREAMKMVLRRILPCLVAAVAGLGRDPSLPDSTRYLEAVRSFADTVLKHGRDTYGEQKTPLFVDGLHVETLEPVRWICRGETWKAQSRRIARSSLPS